MASVRASIVSQARQAAARLSGAAGDVPATDSPVVDQLVRCANLSGDAAQTLEWALEILRAHSDDREGQLASQLLRAARARVDNRTTPPAAPSGGRQRHSRSLAWV